MNIAPLPSRLRDGSPFLALLLAAVADGLIFQSLGNFIGLPVPLFLTTLMLAVAARNHRTLTSSARLPAVLSGGALLALLESVDALSLAVAVACVAALALAATGRLPKGLDVPGSILHFLAAGPFAFLRDEKVRRRFRIRQRARRVGSISRAAAWAVWIMPVALALGFVVLLASGNPILSRWLSRIDLGVLFYLLDPVRLIFWGLAIVLVWPFLRPRLRNFRTLRDSVGNGPLRLAPPAMMGRTLPDVLFSRAAIVRALVLFNAVFAVQTTLDAFYLWGGMELPAGISHAAYAHRGAYTLIATALLAAGFVLLATRPGTEAASDGRIRTLVYLWTGQNVVLVLSSMLRLDLYVEAYALTHWRLAAFLWMALVAVGLLLIVARVAMGRTNRWLIGANLTAAAAMLYGCGFIDLDAKIASFNVEHSREIDGEGRHLDRCYLVSLGPAAIPAIDEFLAAASSFQSPDACGNGELSAIRDSLARQVRRRSRDWRSWTFRNWRLTRYVEARGAMSAPASPAQVLER